MSKPPMQASGVFFMPKKREVYTSYTAAGDFMVQVHALQRNPSGQLECYALRMTGAAALRWHQQHSPQLQPGTPLLAHWHRQHTTIDNNRVRIVATCSSIAIAQRGVDGVSAQRITHGVPAQACTCPSGDGSLRWPCPAHPPSAAPVVLPEPVMAQVRYIASQSTKWSNCTVENADAMVGGAYEVRYLYTEQQVRELLAQATCHQAQPVKQEPFGYFKPFVDGWMDCKETDEGARPLYEAPQPQAEELEAMTDMLETARTELEMLRKALGVAVEPHQTLADRMIGAAIAKKPQVDALDAERYRWLRDEWLNNEPEAINMERAKGQRGLDAAIDAAIAARKENK